MIQFEHHVQFITITCLNWLAVLQNNHHKQIITDALQNRITRQQVTVYAFVIMPNHLHIIWQLHDGMIREDFQRDFLKFTARAILRFMRLNNDPMIELLKVKASDRYYQVWERNSLSIDIYSEKVLLQKLNYLHNNPVQVKWKLAELPEDYTCSSVSFYETGDDPFGWLKHFRG